MARGAKPELFMGSGSSRKDKKKTRIPLTKGSISALQIFLPSQPGAPQ